MGSLRPVQSEFMTCLVADRQESGFGSATSWLWIVDSHLSLGLSLPVCAAGKGRAEETCWP